MRRLFTLLCALAAGGPGCGEQLSIPVPQPVPLKVRQSTPGKDRHETVVAGLPQAVAGKGRVRLRDARSGLEVVVPSTAQGTFVGTLAVGAEADLYGRFETDQGQSAEVSLTLRALGLPPQLTRTRGEAGLVSAPDAKGLVTVSNDAGPGQPLLVAATPDSEVIVSHAGLGTVVTTRTDKEGRFRAQLAAAAGDTIQLFLASVDDRGLTSDFLIATVPAP
ncbi:MAG: hypothetical protein IT371_05005 [Deltaproteobacteria bacterium]|nr:hypothetical protein [Deltaproteobacteria bacterium]